MEEGGCRRFPGLPVPPALLSPLCLYLGVQMPTVGLEAWGLFDG